MMAEECKQHEENAIDCGEAVDRNEHSVVEAIQQPEKKNTKRNGDEVEGGRAAEDSGDHAQIGRRLRRGIPRECRLR
jgi:hypothetical protein